MNIRYFIFKKLKQRFCQLLKQVIAALVLAILPLGRYSKTRFVKVAETLHGRRENRKTLFHNQI